MDVRTYQQRALTRLGDDLTDRRLWASLAVLIGEASAARTLLDLDGGDAHTVTDECVVALVGGLVLAVTEAACVLGVDLEQAMAWGERAAEARAVVALLDDVALVSRRAP